MADYYRCPRCGKDNSVKPLIDQPCEPDAQVVPPTTGRGEVTP